MGLLVGVVLLVCVGRRGGWLVNVCGGIQDGTRACHKHSKMRKHICRMMRGVIFSQGEW